MLPWIKSLPHRLAVAGLLALVAAAAIAPPARAQEAENNVNLAAALENACVVGILSPQRMIKDESLELLPWEMISVAGVEEFGIDPVTISRAVVFVKTPENLEVAPQAGMVIRLTEPADEAAIVKATDAEPLPGDGARRYMSARLGMIFTLVGPKSLVVVNNPAMLEPILTPPTERPSGQLIELLTTKGAGSDLAVAISIDKLRPLIKEQLRQAPALPPPFENLKTLPDHISTIELHATMTEEGTVGLTVGAVDEAAAVELEKMANNWLQIGKQMMLAEVEKETAKADPDDPFAPAMQQYVQRISARVMEMLRPRREGTELAFLDHEDGPSFNGMATNGVLIGLLLPAVQAARESARRMSSMNNMKQIGLAMHMYHNAHGHLPAQASYDADGKPLLSWRVHLLPFMEQQALYEKFRLDEPWDSPHNLELSKTIVPVYQSPNMEPSNKTLYLAPAGQGLFMDGSKERRFRDILDGLSNTIMLVEADRDQAVVWTKPQDLAVDLENPKKGLGNLRPGIFNAGLMDGSVKAISNDIDVEVLKGLFTIAGRETVRLD